MPRSPTAPPPGSVRELESATIRFAGDSGDGMQLAGAQFANASAILGNDIATLPDFPAEIRAPAGTLAGVSAFQVRFSSRQIHTPGDVLNALVAMNPAALKTNLKDLEPGGILIVNADAFTAPELERARCKSNPLEDGSLKGYRVLRVPVNALNREAVAECKLSAREAERCKNFFALGLVYWMYERPMEPTLRWIRDKFSQNPGVMDANARALKAGYNYGETCEIAPVHYRVPRAELAPGTYRKITGNAALVLGLTAAARRAGKELVYSGCPILPATGLLEGLADLKRFGVKTLQAEDEMAAVGIALGASFGGAIGVAGTSGPGLCLQSEAIGLAVMAELPLVVVDIQRGGPSTGLPTKTEQADLLQAMFGRNGESPVPVLAPKSPADCFALSFEAVRIAVEFMTPVVLLSDVHIASGAEPWAIPKAKNLPPIAVSHPERVLGNPTDEPGKFLPYRRDARGVRPWALPGTPGLEHRIGGLEKEDGTGNVSYEAQNHERMVQARARKVANVAWTIPDLIVEGCESGDLLIVGWGGTYGAIATAVENANRRGLKVGHAHLRYLNPMPSNTGDVLKRFGKVLIAELNSGQLRLLIRAEFLVDAHGLNKVQGKPFRAGEIEAEIERLLETGKA